jgi:outer membrane lipoprotein LolB
MPCCSKRSADSRGNAAVGSRLSGAPPTAAALALVLTACATAPLAPTQTFPSRADEPFGIEGRLSARRGNDAVSVTFVWNHAPPKDDFVVSSPLGATVAEMSGDSSTRRVEVRAADGRTDTASDWSALTERFVGFPLPVEGLAYWAQGSPRPGAVQTAEVDAAGRLRVLRQDGCEIVYTYAENAAPLPSQLRTMCNDLELRIVIDKRAPG